jgi:Protein of unknown function (DUF3040)
VKDKPVSRMHVREAIMAMSEDERRQLRETEAELAQQRRLVNLASHLKSASVDTGLKRITVLWVAGGSLGLILVIVSAVLHNIALGAADVGILAGTLILAGVASLVVEVRGQRREQRMPHGRHPHSP